MMDSQAAKATASGRVSLSRHRAVGEMTRRYRRDWLTRPDVGDASPRPGHAQIALAAGEFRVGLTHLPHRFGTGQDRDGFL